MKLLIMTLEMLTLVRLAYLSIWYNINDEI